MQELLESAESAALALAPGLTLLRRYLDDTAQRALASELEELVSLAPWFLPRMPRSGRPFSVKMTNCGRLGWVSDRDGSYRYQAAHPVAGEAWPPIPISVLDICRAVASYSHLPEACLVNFYDSSTKMGLHQDRNEAELAAPVVSISLGDSCSLSLRRLAPNDPAKKLGLLSGDVIVMGGPARLLFHGVDRIYPSTSDLLPYGGRINLTLRRVSRP